MEIMDMDWLTLNWFDRSLRPVYTYFKTVFCVCEKVRTLRRRMHYDSYDRVAPIERHLGHPNTKWHMLATGRFASFTIQITFNFQILTSFSLYCAGGLSETRKDRKRKNADFIQRQRSRRIPHGFKSFWPFPKRERERKRLPLKLVKLKVQKSGNPISFPP
jgi:hypothetical protein